MAVYFFDSSALFKRYATEIGTNWVLGITNPAAGHDIYLVSITGAEVVSAKFLLCLRRTWRESLAEFKDDFHNQYQRVAVNDSLISHAMVLAETYELRGYDAVQLAASNELNQLRRTAGLSPLTLVSADHQINNAAVKEALVVEDPTAYP